MLGAAQVGIPGAPGRPDACPGRAGGTLAAIARTAAVAAALVILCGQAAAGAEAQRRLADEGARQFEDLARQLRAQPRRPAKPKPPTPAVPQAASDLLDGSDLTAESWYLIGPFDNEAGRGFDKTFPPEKGFDAAAACKGANGVVTWQNARWGIEDGRFTKIAGVHSGTTHWFSYPPRPLRERQPVQAVAEWFTVYLHRVLDARRAGPVGASIRSTAGIAVWLNGAKVLSRPTAEERRPREEKLRLGLKQGRNSLLVKLCHGKGGCGFSFDIEHPPDAGHPSAAPRADLRLLAGPYRREAVVWPTDRDPADVVLRRTAALLADLAGRLPARQAAELSAGLRDLQRQAERTAPESLEARRSLYDEACRLRRRVALANPLLDFDRLLFIKKHLSLGNHFIYQWFGRNAVPGGGLFVLSDPFAPAPKLRDVLADSVVANGRLRGRKLQGGCFLSPDLSYDGKTIVFAYAECMGADWGPESCFHVFRVGADGRGLVQLTDGAYNDFDPCFLPDGRICFISERRGGFGRCFAPHTPTYTLHTMDPDGRNIAPLSFHETNEWHPSVTHDGKIIYTRWDYVDRETNVAHHPWLTSPDGRDARAVHANFPDPPNGRRARPWVESDVKCIPGSAKFAATAAPHHGQAFGSLVMIDPDVEDDDLASPVRRITPDVPFPEAEMSGKLPWNFATAWPLSEHYYLCVYAPSREVPAGVYLVDAFGNRELIYRDDAINCQSPMPLRPRPRPPVLPAAGRAEADAESATPPPAGAEAPSCTIACVNAYDALMPWPRGTTIAALRVVEVFPKATAWADYPRISMGSQSLARGVLGTVPVEPDGSAHFIAPAGKVLYFQALDDRGLAVQSMRSATYVHPGRRLVCQGCHERRWRSPAPPARTPLALRRPPSPITPDVDGSYPVLYPRLVQPVLDRRCVPCHRKNPRAPDLTGQLTDPRGEPAFGGWSRSYDALAPLGFWYHNLIGRLPDVPHGGVRTTPGEFGARASALFRMLQAGHHRLKLPEQDLHRIALWLDTNTNFYGAYFEASRQARGEAVRPTLNCTEPTLAEPAPARSKPAGGAAPPPRAETIVLAAAPRVTLTLVRLPAGKFTMGAPQERAGFCITESPQREVTISRPFYMSVHETTQKQHRAVMGENPSRFTDDDRPVENVTWAEAVEFCRRLSAKTGRSVRLPTEAEWEYACRAAAQSRFSFGSDWAALPEYAWCAQPSSGGTRPVGQGPANAWGLHDMHGNVLEWCGDWYVGSYRDAPITDPSGPVTQFHHQWRSRDGRGPLTGPFRVARGGSWLDSPEFCRSACRRGIVPTYRSCCLGYRVVVEADDRAAPHPAASRK